MQEYIKKLRYPLLIISGILSALGVVYPTAFGAFAWISLIPAALVLLSLGGKVKSGSMYLYGFVFYYAYYMISYHWFVSMYPMDFTGMTPKAAVGVIALAVFGVSALQAALSALINILVFPYARDYHGYSALPVYAAFAAALFLFVFAGRKLHTAQDAQLLRIRRIAVPVYLIVLFLLHILLLYIKKHLYSQKQPCPS